MYQKTKTTWALLDLSIALVGSEWQWMIIVSSTLNLQRRLDEARTKPERKRKTETEKLMHTQAVLWR